jgi:diacylglycerol kinase (ATP)
MTHSHPREAGLSPAASELPQPVPQPRGGHVVEVAFGAPRRTPGVRPLASLETRQPRASARATAMRAARRVQLVVDPRAGDGLATVLGSRLARQLRTSRYDVQPISVDDPARMREQIVRNGRGLHCLVVVGGDSTLDEVAGAAMELHVPLLPVPAGSSNTFARSLGYQATILSVLELLERGVVQWIDAGRVGRSLFLSSQVFGFTHYVAPTLETAPAASQHRLQRSLHDWRAAARSVAGTPLPALAVDVDGLRVADGAVMVVVANVPTSRGFVSLTPTASPFDGFLDVFVVPPMTKTRLIALLFAFLVQAPGRWRHVRCRRASRVRVVGPGAAAHELCVLPAAVPVLLRPSSRSLSPRLRLAS